MIELPEALTLSRQIGDALAGRRVDALLPPTKPHKFCWWSAEPEEYAKALAGSRLTGAQGFGIYVELAFDKGKYLCINDGVNPRLLPADGLPRDYQLALVFGKEALCMTVAMYGGIVLHGGDYDNEYYLKSRAYISPFTPEFRERFFGALSEVKPTLSAKAFLATEQRFPGIGNGTVQDILFDAGINPRRKLCTLCGGDRERLYSSTVGVLREMTERGGRDTEKDIYGAPGGYKTKMSKNALAAGCPVCGGGVTKEAYLGGSVYYCAHCQPKGEEKA